MLPFCLPPASEDHPCSPPILLKLQVLSFLFLSCKCHFYVTACRYNFFYYYYYLPFLKYFFFPPLSLAQDLLVKEELTCVWCPNFYIW